LSRTGGPAERSARLAEKLADERVFYLNIVAGAKRWVLGSPAEVAMFLLAATALTGDST
jgi:hypothetical protein